MVVGWRVAKLASSFSVVDYESPRELAEVANEMGSRLDCYVVVQSVMRVEFVLEAALMWVGEAAAHLLHHFDDFDSCDLVVFAVVARFHQKYSADFASGAALGIVCVAKLLFRAEVVVRFCLYLNCRYLCCWYDFVFHRHHSSHHQKAESESWLVFVELF